MLKLTGFYAGAGTNGGPIERPLLVERLLDLIAGKTLFHKQVHYF